MPSLTSKDARSGKRLDSDERRGQILAVARRLFTERPYGSVSTIEIADAAGVTRGLLHHYFGTKRELYLEVVRELVDNPAVSLIDLFAAGRPERPGAGLWPDWDKCVDMWMDLVEANRDTWFVAISAGETGQDKTMHEILDRARDRTADEVLVVLGLDEKATPEVRPLVRAFGAFAEEITREWLQRANLNRSQARTLLAGSLPMLVERLLPDVIADRRGQCSRQARKCV